MSELKWICPKCASEETVALRSVVKSDRSIEFAYEGKVINTSMILSKSDMLLFCPICSKFKLINERDYVDTCAKTMKQAKEGVGGAPTTSSITIGVALGVIIGSLILYMITSAIFF